MKQDIISVNHLRKSFAIHEGRDVGFGSAMNSLMNGGHREVVAVDDISFNIYKEEFVAFIGPNGAGKTTTLKILSGLLAADSGSVTVAGYDPSHRKHDFLSKISLIMGQKSQLWWELPAVESFLLNKEIYCVEEKRYSQVVNGMVELLGIGNILNVPVRKLSLGERMKCELVVSLLHTPEVLFLDEPTIGLDILSQKRLRDFLKEYNRLYKATILLTSHNMEDIKDLCKRVIVIDKGKIIYDGKIAELNSRFVNNKYITFLTDRRIKSNELDMYGRVVSNSDGCLVLDVQKSRVTEVVSGLLERFSVRDLSIEEPQLEEVVRNIFQGKYLV